MEMEEVKIFTYNEKGTYLSHIFTKVHIDSNTYESVNKKPQKYFNITTGETEFKYVTDDLNTDKKYASKKWLLEPHRLYFFTIDPKNKEVELEFTKNMESIIDKLLVCRKLKNYRCIHRYANKENNMFRFGSIGESIFDKIYYISDDNNINDAKLAFRDIISECIDEVNTELSFYKSMLEKALVPEVVVKDCEDVTAFIKAVDEQHIEEIVVKKSWFASNPVFKRVIKLFTSDTLI